MPPLVTQSVRIVAVIRQSRTHDQTISPETQRSIIEHWVSSRNMSSVDGTKWVIVAWAIDLDVSAGKTTPWQRPELGRWLTDEKSHEWDMLLTWKLDRICRSSYDFAILVKWLEERGKSLACTHDPIDLSTPVGRAVAQIMAILAELELRSIEARNRESHRMMRSAGKYSGGRIPFGRMRIDQDGETKIVIDPEMLPHFEWILEQVYSGRSIGSIAAELNERQVPTSLDRQRQLRGKPMKGEIWTAANLWKVLRHRHLIGQKEYKGAVIRNNKGEPIQFFEPLMSVSEWQRLQAELDSRRQPYVGSQRNTWLMRKVGFCGVCQRSVVSQHYIKKGKRYAPRYRCYSQILKYQGVIKEHCGNPMIRADVLEGYLEDWLLKRYGDLPWMEKVYVPGEDHTKELDQISDAINTIRKEKDLGLYDGDEDEYLSRLTALVERRKALLSKPVTPSTYDYRPSEKTVAEHWASLDTESRNLLLIRMRVQVFYDLSKGFQDIWIRWGDMDQLRRLAQGQDVDVETADA